MTVASALAERRLRNHSLVVELHGPGNEAQALPLRPVISPLGPMTTRGCGTSWLRFLRTRVWRQHAWPRADDEVRAAIDRVEPAATKI